MPNVIVDLLHKVFLSEMQREKPHLVLLFWRVRRRRIEFSRY